MNDVRVLSDQTLAPEVRGVVGVGLGKGSKGGLDEVSSGSGFSFGLGVDVLNTTELEQLLGDWGSNHTSSSGGGNQSNLDGSSFSGDLAGDGG